MSRKSREKRLLRLMKGNEEGTPEAVVEKLAEGGSKLKGIKGFYDRNANLLLLIPIILFVLAIAQISYQTYTTGDFLNKGVSLKGGTTITIPFEKETDAVDLEKFLSSDLKGKEVSVRILKESGIQIGIIIDTNIDGTKTEEVDALISKISEYTKMSLTETDYNIEVMGSSLGASFFREAFIALVVSFVLMAIVVFLSFKTFVPSGAVILAALGDIVITIAIVNLLGVKVSTAGIAAFLMLIGYSVDTDLLLTTRVLRRKEEPIIDRIFSSMATGSTMSITTIAAASVGFIVSKSDVLKQIMLIIAIGVCIDLITTWLMNAAIIRAYAEKKERKGNAKI